MSARPPIAAVALIVLVGGISALFLASRSEAPSGGAEETKSLASDEAAEPLAGLAPRVRGLKTGGMDLLTAEARTRQWVDAVLDSRQGPPRTVIHAALAHPDWAVQWTGAMAIPRYGSAGEELARALVPLMAAENAWVRRAAVQGAAYVGDGFDTMVEALRHAALDPEASVREPAVRTLARRSARQLELLPVFVRALEDTDAEVRGAAAYGIAQIEIQERLPLEAQQKIVAKLARALEDESSEVRMYAAMALGRAGDAGAPALDGLLELLDDEHALVRTQSSTALGSLGTVALPVLERALSDDRGQRAPLLLWSLRLIGEPALPVIEAAVRHPTALVRVHAAMKLWELKRDTESTVKVLIAALGAPNLDAVLQAVRGLGRLGPKAASSISALEGMREHEDEAIRRAVHGALTLIDPGRK